VKVSGPKTYFLGLARRRCGAAPIRRLFASSGFTFTDRVNTGYQARCRRAKALVFGYDYERQAG
jgi:hypothetical protein